MCVGRSVSSRQTLGRRAGIRWQQAGGGGGGPRPGQAQRRAPRKEHCFPQSIYAVQFRTIQSDSEFIRLTRCRPGGSQSTRGGQTRCPAARPCSKYFCQCWPGVDPSSIYCCCQCWPGMDLSSLYCQPMLAEQQGAPPKRIHHLLPLPPGPPSWPPGMASGKQTLD